MRLVDIGHDEVVVDHAPLGKHEFLDLPGEPKVFFNAVFQGGDLLLGVRHLQSAFNHHEQVHLFETLVHIIRVSVRRDLLHERVVHVVRKGRHEDDRNELVRVADEAAQVEPVDSVHVDIRDDDVV